MVAEAACCTCRECGAICRGRFNGCATVWAAATGPDATFARVAGRTPLPTMPVATIGAPIAAEAPAPALANPLAKRPKHRNKYLARFKPAAAVESVSPEPTSAPAPEPFDPLDVGLDDFAPAPAPSAPSTPAAPRPPAAPTSPPSGLAEIRQRLEGLQGRVRELGRETGDRA
jgi:hypothetical protein